MRITPLTANDFQRQPWKNGGGMTTEVARHDIEGRLCWRVSIARVESSGPFSVFPGLDRTILLLKGAGMELSFDSAPALRIDRAGLPHSFAGDWNTACRLIDGPVEDFNLMVDRALARSMLQVIDLGPDAQEVAIQGDAVLMFVWQGSVRVGGAGQSWQLNTGEALRGDTVKSGHSMPFFSLRAGETPARVVFIVITMRRG